MGKQYRGKIMKIREKLIREMPIFGGLKDKDLELIFSLTKEEEFSSGELIVEEGSLGNMIYIIKNGEALVEKICPVTKEKQELTTLGPTDSFGEMSLIDPQPRAATVKSLTQTTVITLSAKALHEIYVKKPETYVIILMNLAREMSRRLRRAIEVVATLQAGVHMALPALHV